MRKVYTQIQAISILSLLGMAVCFGTLRSPFMYDDLHAIVDNPHIKNLRDFQALVGIENIFNRSVVLLTYAVNREVGQLDVFGFHLVNILLHICAGITLYFLSQRLLTLESRDIRRRLASLPLLAAAIHLMHPLAVEPVAYLASRSSLLVTLVYLLGFYYFIRTVEAKEPRQKPQKLLFTLLVILFFFLGSGSKGIIVTLPAMGMIFLWFQTPKMATKKLAWMTLLVLSPMLVYLGFRYAQTGGIFTLPNDPGSLSMDRGLYFLTQMKVLVSYYLVKLFLPFNLNFEPDIRLVSGFLDPEWMAGGAAIVLLGVSLSLQKSRLAMFAGLWALVTIFPTSSFIPLKQIVSEHRIYLPSIGICLVLGIGLLTAVRAPLFRLPMVFTLLSIFALLTLDRGFDFSTEIRLWRDTATKSPKKALVRNNLAAAYLAQEKLDDAMLELEAVLNIDPEYTDAHINLGFIHSRQKKWQEAGMAFDRAILLGSQKAAAFFNAGRVRTHLNRTEEALPFFVKAVEMKPHRATYHFELGNAYRALTRMDDALAQYRLTLKSDPDHREAHNNIGVIFWTLKQYGLAEEAFRKTLVLGADNFEIHNNLANIYMIQKRPTQAIPHLQRLILLRPENARAHQLLEIALTLEKANNP